MNKETRHSLSLLTLNGKCDHTVNLFPISCPKLEADYCVRHVRNFLACKFKDIGIDLMIYARGGFKLTVKNTPYAKRVICNYKNFLNKIIDILEVFYRSPISRVSVRVSQLATVLRYPFVTTDEHFVLTYEHLLSKETMHRNKLLFTFDDHTFIHTVNWMLLEDGASSFYFKVKLQDGTNLGGFKIYNNLKIVLFTYRVDQLSVLMRLVIDFVQNRIV